MNPDEVIMASLGQRYQDLPFNERFGDWPVEERQMWIQRMLDDFNKTQPRPGGRDVLDPLGHRGVRDPESGMYWLKEI